MPRCSERSGPTLEERLATEMAEQAARTVVDEPLPLVNARREPERRRPPRLPRRRPLDPASSLLEALEAGVAAAEPELPAWTVRDAPAAREAPGPQPRQDAAAGREPVVDWTLAEARTALRAVAGDREGLKDVVLRYARRTFDFVAAFAVVRGTAMGWDARGEGAEAVAVAQVSFPLDVPVGLPHRRPRPFVATPGRCLATRRPVRCSRRWGARRARCSSSRSRCVDGWSPCSTATGAVAR